jgi:hypothetical protein
LLSWDLLRKSSHFGLLTQILEVSGGEVDGEVAEELFHGERGFSWVSSTVTGILNLVNLSLWSRKYYHNAIPHPAGVGGTLPRNGWG